MTEDEKIIHEYATKLFMESFKATLDAGLLKEFMLDLKKMKHRQTYM